MNKKLLYIIKRNLKVKKIKYMKSDPYKDKCPNGCSKNVPKFNVCKVSRNFAK